MNQTPIKLGPLALLLTVISICLTTLAILVYTTAGADMRLAEKYADTVHTRYELEAQGQQFLAGVAKDGIAPAEAEQDDEGVYWVTLEQDGSLLRIGLAEDADGYRVAAWRHERAWAQDTDIGNLWTGN